MAGAVEDSDGKSVTPTPNGEVELETPERYVHGITHECTVPQNSLVHVVPALVTLNNTLITVEMLRPATVPCVYSDG